MKIKVSEKNYDKFDAELQYIYNSMVELFEEEDEIVEFSKQAQTFRKQFLDQARALFISMRRDIEVVPVKKKYHPVKSDQTQNQTESLLTE